MTGPHWLPELQVQAIAQAPDPSWGAGLLIASTLASAALLALAYAAGRAERSTRTPGRTLARLSLASGVLTYWLICGYSFDFVGGDLTVYPPCSRLPGGGSICRDYVVRAVPFALAAVTPLATLVGAWAWQRRHPNRRADG
jgi:hypothetical protein